MLRVRKRVREEERSSDSRESGTSVRDKPTPVVVDPGQQKLTFSGELPVHTIDWKTQLDRYTRATEGTDDIPRRPVTEEERQRLLQSVRDRHKKPKPKPKAAIATGAVATTVTKKKSKAKATTTSTKAKAKTAKPKKPKKPVKPTETAKIVKAVTLEVSVPTPVPRMLLPVHTSFGPPVVREESGWMAGGFGVPVTSGALGSSGGTVGGLAWIQNGFGETQGWLNEFGQGMPSPSPTPGMLSAPPLNPVDLRLWTPQEVFVQTHTPMVHIERQDKAMRMIPRHIQRRSDRDQQIPMGRFVGRAVPTLQASEVSVLLYPRIHELAANNAVSYLPPGEAERLIECTRIAQRELEGGYLHGMLERDARNSEEPQAWPLAELFKPDLLFPEEQPECTVDPDLPRLFV